MSFGVNSSARFSDNVACPLLEKSEQGRVVMMTSVAHAWGTVRFDDLNYTPATIVLQPMVTASSVTCSLPVCWRKNSARAAAE
jgi:hypothetical protein